MTRIFIDFTAFFIYFLSKNFDKWRQPVHAVIIVSDRMEDAVNLKIVNGKIQVIERCCACIKNSSVDHAKKLIRYLRDEMLFEKHNTTFLRSSAHSSREILEILSCIIYSHQGEDLLVYYSGHGGVGCWAFNNNYPDEKIGYSELEILFNKFTGRLVLINDCCHALAVQPYLKRAMKKRYLLFGSSRKNMMGLSDISVLGPILGAWILGKVAEPRVISMGRDDERDTIDFCARRSFPRIFFRSSCWHDYYLMIKDIPLSEQPSLRRGSNLDYIWFSKITGH